MEAYYVQTVAFQIGTLPARVFGLSAEYAETPHSKKYLVNAYHEWHYRGKVPDFVADFCIDFLAGRINKEELVL